MPLSALTDEALEDLATRVVEVERARRFAAPCKRGRVISLDRYRTLRAKIEGSTSVPRE
jgi:hypothetical protein